MYPWNQLHKNNLQKGFNHLKKRIAYFLSDAGLTAHNRNYTPYIILSRLRSGSNLLFTALKPHPNIICFNEVFGWEKEILFKYPGYRWWAHDPDMFAIYTALF